MCLILWAQAGAAGFGYLELRARGSAGPADPKEIPLYLAFPDTLGALPVAVFLEAPQEKARAALQGGDWRAKPISPAEGLFLQALRHMVDGRMQEAKESITLLKNQSVSAELRAYLRVDAALLLYLAGFPEEAEKDWRKMRKSAEPAAEGAWRNLYSLYLEKRQYSKADKLVEDALRASPRNRWAIQAKGFLLRMLRPEMEWEAFLRERSSWKDSLFEIQIAYGKFLKDRGRWEEAAKYYNRGLEGAPRNGPAWLELADVYYRMGDLVAAERCIFSSFQYGIRDPYVYELYGLVLQDLALVFKDMDVVYRGFRDEIREFHKDVDARKVKKIMERAEKILEEGFNHDLQSRSMAQLLYRLYCGNGRTEAALNLRNGFWFHFSGPPRPQPPPRLFSGYGYREPRLHVRFSEVTFPLMRALEKTDFFEPF